MRTLRILGFAELHLFVRGGVVKLGCEWFLGRAQFEVWDVDFCDRFKKPGDTTMYEKGSEGRDLVVGMFTGYCLEMQWNRR